MHLANSFNVNKRLLLFISGLIFTSGSFAANDGMLNFKTVVTKGSCEFDNNNIIDKDVNFNQIFTTADMNSLAIGTPAASETFVLSVVCTGYEANEAKPIGVVVRAGTQTAYDNQIFYPQEDKTHTGFTLKVCEGNGSQCENVEQNTPYKFTNNSNELIDIAFVVSFVKRQNTVSAGTAKAAVIIEYLQD